MKTRLAFVLGAATGYVLGARAGRKSYEQIKTQATNLWNNPKVQDSVQKATDTISEKAPAVAEKAKDLANTGVEKTADKVEEIKENRAADKAKRKAPADVVSDPATAPEVEGPADSE